MQPKKINRHFNQPFQLDLILCLSMLIYSILSSDITKPVDESWSSGFEKFNPIKFNIPNNA